MALCIAAVHWSLSPSVSSLKYDHDAKQNRFKYGAREVRLWHGYWLSYPGDECLKCNCSLNAMIIAEADTSLDNGQMYIHFLTMFMNKSDCVGQQSPESSHHNAIVMEILTT